MTRPKIATLPLDENGRRELFAQLRRLEDKVHYRTSSSHLLTDESGLAETFLNFDHLVLSPGGARRVALAYEEALESIRRHRRTTGQNDISYFAAINKDRGATVGAILIAGLLCDYTSLPYVIVSPSRDYRPAQVTWPSLTDMAGTLRGQVGVLITDHCTTGDEAIRVCNLLQQREGKVAAILTYSRAPSRVEAEHSAYLNQHGIILSSVGPPTDA